jgi:hypothetical protein
MGKLEDAVVWWFCLPRVIPDCMLTSSSEYLLAVDMSDPEN